MIRKKKVFIVITRMDLGGAQEVALESAAGLDPENFEVRLLAGPGGRLDAEAQRRLGERFVLFPSLVHPIQPLNDLKALFQLFIYFLREQPDIVHTHSSKAGFLGRFAAWLAGVPFILHTVHGWSFHDQMGQWSRQAYIQLERFLAGLSDRLCVVALSCRDKGLVNGIGEAGQYHLLRASVDLSAWASQGLRPHEGLRVGCVANCKPQKNPLDFVRVAALALQDCPDLSFEYIGDGPLRSEAEALARSLGIQERVLFRGWVDDPKAAASSFDLFLLCSLWEGLPCVFAEVLAMGIPVVATCVDGAAEIIREGENGYLCQPGDCSAMADRIVSLAKNAALRERLALAARQVPEEFGFPAMKTATASLYAGL